MSILIRTHAVQDFLIRISHFLYSQFACYHTYIHSFDYISQNRMLTAFCHLRGHASRKSSGRKDNAWSLDNTYSSVFVCSEVQDGMCPLDTLLVLWLYLGFKMFQCKTLSFPNTVLSYNMDTWDFIIRGRQSVSGPVTL